ncbi:hypothetical protein KJ693_05140 [bacterium]|nr:hypothetical protein [bacterium]MBU1614683.1 hypothetical protein [bacterium]
MISKFSLHILLDKEDNIQIAHCLEFDIVAQGKDRNEAIQNLLDAVELQVKYAIETDNLDNLYHPAPAEYWQKLVRAKHYPETPERKMLPFIRTLDCNYVTG